MKRLLIVDDHAGLRELFRFHMHREGYLVDEAEDGLDALAKLERTKPDLIVLDLMMPRLDGWGVLKRLLSDGHADIPVIAVTGFSEFYDKDAILKEPNVKAYLTKPLSYADLSSMIKAELAATPAKLLNS